MKGLMQWPCARFSCCLDCCAPAKGANVFHHLSNHLCSEETLFDYLLNPKKYIPGGCHLWSVQGVTRSSVVCWPVQGSWAGVPCTTLCTAVIAGMLHFPRHGCSLRRPCTYPRHAPTLRTPPRHQDGVCRPQEARGAQQPHRLPQAGHRLSTCTFSDALGASAAHGARLAAVRRCAVARCSSRGLGCPAVRASSKRRPCVRQRRVPRKNGRGSGSTHCCCTPLRPNAARPPPSGGWGAVPGHQYALRRPATANTVAACGDLLSPQGSQPPCNLSLRRSAYMRKFACQPHREVHQAGCCSTSKLAHLELTLTGRPA